MTNDNIVIKVQQQDFDLGAEMNKLHQNNVDDGATATFCGRVRNNNLEQDVIGLYLEHYPQMTEKQLLQIAQQAKSKWHLGRVCIIHRIGMLNVGEQIVFVGVTSKHRQSAFMACEFIMDFLKVKATFWKKEVHANGQKLWLDAKQSDQNKANSW
ncbi:molybdopterin synthase catalytic subunit MoaE [Thalassotalea marina]|uniref:Molybdopterin synthase catalytic subunit n=1 Tax=Thalassotalea marina TaxID=1673741 RepID=A0A919BB62_9GAMM|nr:molybdopterin synthase catalytic subunit MoaE [Thalassotalea marina]GHF80018.1 molybdenum cofactor biosynthesis protein MoaE [Thalassotalea marina]